MGAMAIIKARAKQKCIVEEAERILNAFKTDRTTKHKATIKVVRRLLLNAPYFIDGNHYEVIAKSIGAGVYKLSLKIGEAVKIDVS